MVGIVKNDEIVIGKLRNCSDIADVMAVFEKFEITENDDMRNLIRRTMGDADIYYSSEISKEQKLEREIEILIDGAWKADELYDLPDE